MSVDELGQGIAWGFLAGLVLFVLWKLDRQTRCLGRVETLLLDVEARSRAVARYLRVRTED